MFSQAVEDTPKAWWFLDNQSTCNIMLNPKLLKNIWKVNKYITLLTQSGSTRTNLMGDMNDYDEPVWFHPGGIANVFALSKMIKKFRVTYDRKDGNGFCVYKTDGTLRVFKKSKRGLFYLDTTNDEEHNVLVKAIADNKYK